MNKRSSLWTAIFAATGLMVLILDGKTAYFGAKDGLELCLSTLIPTLLPFFFLSNILTAGLMGRKIGIFRPICQICRIPSGAEYILITGFLGGYPLGARCISHACQSGVLSKKDGRRMLAICNNCGPAFLFGVAGVLFRQPIVSWILFFIHIFSAIFVGMIIPGMPGQCISKTTGILSPVQALWQSLRAVAGACGWVILFRVLIAVMNRWILCYFSVDIQIAVTGLFELSNGCTQLHQIDHQGLRFILCAGFISFGGLCVLMQTYSAVPNVDHSLYLPGKVLQCLISLFLACLLAAPKYALYPGAAAACIGIFLRIHENKCRNPRKLVV